MPASGTAFPIGTTTVNCSAADSSTNGAAGAFHVTVLGGAQITSNLLSTVTIDGFQQSTDLLQNVLKSLTKGNAAAACSQLNAFINQVNAQTGKSLSAAEASNLVGSANAVKQALGCQ